MSCCGVVLWWVLLGCVLLWCDVVLCYAVLYGRRNLTKNPSLKLSGKSALKTLKKRRSPQAGHPSGARVSDIVRLLELAQEEGRKHLGAV